MNFDNAQQLAKEHPDTFEAPTKEELSKIKIGDSVKVAYGEERFWVTVTKIEKQQVTGTVDNNLLFTDEHGLKYDDSVTFTKDNIYDIY